MLFRKILFWSHLFAEVIGGVVIFVMSFTGFVLMYEEQLVEYAERDVRRVAPSSANVQRLSMDDLIARASKQNPHVKPTGVVLRNDPTAAVAVSFGREGAVYVNPYTGAVLGSGSKLHDWFHDIIDWHRWLGQEGEGRAAGRAITGACNFGFFWLALSGIYLWWPRSWNWRGLKPSLLFNLRLRGKARDWNRHNVIGCWSSAVLVVLTLTGTVMSYPWANDLLYALTGSEPPQRGDRPAGADARARRDRSRVAAPTAAMEVFLARAQAQVPGWEMIALRFQPRGPVTASIQGPDAFHRFQRSQVTFNRATGNVTKWELYSANSTGRKLRTWVRALHTGEAFGFAGQTVAGFTSLAGCFLLWTGFAMAWRRFRFRQRKDFPAVRAAHQTSTAKTPPVTHQLTPRNR